MKPIFAKVLTFAPFLFLAIGIPLIAFGLLSRAEAKYKPSPATIEMSKDIRDAQIFVKEYEQKVLEAKEKATVYRQTICRVEKEACTKEYLDPLGSGVDLSVFIIPSPQS